MGWAIADEDEVAQSIRPVFERKSGTKKHSAHAISNGTMRSFDLTNLIRRIRGSNFNVITRSTKKVVNSSATTKFTTTIKANTSRRSGRSMGGNEFFEEIERRTLVATNTNLPDTTVTISDENIACLTIEALKAAVAL